MNFKFITLLFEKQIYGGYFLKKFTRTLNRPNKFISTRKQLKVLRH